MLNKVGHVGVWPRLVCPRRASTDAFWTPARVQVAVQPLLIGVLPAGRHFVVFSLSSGEEDVTGIGQLQVC